ncbi:MAG: MFS transporter [Cocleimonas sp.]
MRELTRTFYSYLSLHSLLIGVFPFFLPVYLWNHGFKLGEISLFIGISGFAFCAALWVWDRIRRSISLLTLITISLLLAINLLLTVFLLEGMNWFGLIIVGISYGVYNCFFWTTQRALFFERVNTSNSGRNYGNLQMFVGLVLQIGILIGGLLLEKHGLAYVLGFSVIASVIGFIFITKNIGATTSLKEVKPLSFSDIVSFKDGHSSVLIFLVDGLFLFLESFFWLISLFLLAHESFVTLGITVMSLAIIFGILFYFLKNVIDRLDRWRIYRIAVVLYAFSWLLRANVNENQSLFWLFLTLVLITFCTSFFRLAMNKRFYDLARETLNHRYLVLKSYYSQFVIGIVFVAAGLLIGDIEKSESLLIPSYWLGAVLAFIFLLYGATYAKAERIQEAADVANNTTD